VFREDFIAGKTVSLSIPLSVRRERAMNFDPSPTIAEIEAEYADCRGYEFEWGQIVEDLTDPGECAEARAEAHLYPGASWHFVLTELHAKFLDAGITLDRLSELAVRMLEAIAEDAHSELSAEERRERLPDYIRFCSGNDLSVFEIWVSGLDNVPAARRWVDGFFIPDVLPLIISRLRAEHRMISVPPPKPNQLH